MTGVNRRIQTLNVGGVLYFFELDMSNYGIVDPLCFHCNGASESINDELNRVELVPSMKYGNKTYSFVGITLQGLETSSDGKVNTPELVVANVLNGQLGAIGALCRQYNNLSDCKLTIRMTTVEAYDAGTGEETTQIWWIDRKNEDNGATVSFDLTSAMDFKKQQIPTRMILDVCTWAMRGEYRGETCGYTGNKYFDKRGNPVSTIDQDDCGGTCNDCILRYGRGVPIPFGGYLIINKTDY